MEQRPNRHLRHALGWLIIASLIGLLETEQGRSAYDAILRGTDAAAVQRLRRIRLERSSRHVERHRLAATRSRRLCSLHPRRGAPRGVFETKFGSSSSSACRLRRLASPSVFLRTAERLAATTAESLTSVIAIAQTGIREGYQRIRTRPGARSAVSGRQTPQSVSEARSRAMRSESRLTCPLALGRGFHSAFRQEVPGSKPGGATESPSPRCAVTGFSHAWRRAR